MEPLDNILYLFRIRFFFRISAFLLPCLADIDCEAKSARSIHSFGATIHRAPATTHRFPIAGFQTPMLRSFSSGCPHLAFDVCF